MKLENVNLVEGRNDIRLKFIEHDYNCSQDSFDGVFAANFDSLTVTSDECTITPFFLREDYKLTSVDMVVEDEVPYLVYTGTDLIYSGYEESELAAAILLDLQRNGGYWESYVNDGTGRTLTVDADGNFTLKVDISSVHSEGVFMLHFGLPLNSNKLPADAKVENGVTVATNEDGSNKTFTIGRYVYELIPTDKDSWNLIVVKVTTA